jgi:acyl-coenzyme A thioesterase 13
MAGNFAKLFDKFVKNPALKNSFGDQLVKHLRLTDLHAADPSKVVYLYRIPHENINIQGTTHGGALASLIDLTTTISILKVTPNRTTSISLNTEFLVGTKPSDELKIETTIRKAGRNIIFTSCDMYHGDKLICTGTHIKATMKEDWEFL